MNNFFLRLYVATKVHMTTRPEDGFVTAEHLALAVVGVVIVAAVGTVFRDQLESAITRVFGEISPTNVSK